MNRLTFISPKAEKRSSGVHGRGLFALEKFAAGEVVTVKGGHIMTKSEWRAIENSIGPAEIQIEDDLVIGPRTKDEYESCMMHINHSCDPNVGVDGQIVFKTMKEVMPGEELTIDYAMIDDFDGEIECGCNKPNCRKVVSGRDWKRKDLQKKFGNYFSNYLKRRF